jgi:SRSO17 transposase
VVLVVAGCQAAPSSAVCTRAGCGFSGEVPRWTAEQRTAQDRLDACLAVGDRGPWRQQAVLGRGRWDADALRDIVREYALDALGDEEAVLVIDETGFLKQGKASCGVARQYTGSAGKITNCQIGVFAAYRGQPVG